MPRAVLIVLDSVGIGGAPDAAHYGDAGSNTVGHLAEHCAAGLIGPGRPRSGPLHLPNLVALGFGEACRIATGRVPPGLASAGTPSALYGSAREISAGKDTPSGHWELAGVPVGSAWGFFPTSTPSFPRELVDALCRKAGLAGILGNCHASGTAIVAELGAEHIATGKPICYTSADSVFQIAAHEQAFGLARLYNVCRVARQLTAPLRIARVIARPFLGEEPDSFRRTGNRRDFSEPAPQPTVLDIAEAQGRNVVSIGKIADIFGHRGTGRTVRAHGNDAVVAALMQELSSLADGLIIANLVDFDTEYGHRRDVSGYAHALERFDAQLPAILNEIKRGDLVIITADHGCDPTWPGTEHTREQVPVLACCPGIAGRSIGERATFSDVGASISTHLAIPRTAAGKSFL